MERTAAPKIIASGHWSPETRWELLIDHPLPPDQLCVTAFCIAFKDGKIALTRHHRGWDIPGGHREPGETIEAGARRELFEETGLEVGPLLQIGVSRVDMTTQQERDGRPYPFPTSFGLWYTAAVTTEKTIPAGSESKEVGFFTPDDIRAFNFNFQPCIEHALTLHQRL